MITVLSVNKKGNKIVSYTCTDGENAIELTKDRLCKYIENKKVTNAKIQNYNGKVIVRITDNKEMKIKSDKPDYTILDYIYDAKNKGISQLSISNIIVNTHTLTFTKLQDKPISKTTKTSNKSESIDDILNDAKIRMENNEDTKLRNSYKWMCERVQIIQKHKDEIEEVIDTANKLYDFYKNGKFTPEEKKINTWKLKTNACEHTLGLYGEFTLGQKAGGACGEYDFVTDGTKVRFFTHDDGSIISLEEFSKVYNIFNKTFIRHTLDNFENAFEEYRTKLNRYIESVKKL